MAEGSSRHAPLAEDVLAELVSIVSARAKRTRLEMRLHLGAEALLTLREAARLIPRTEREAREWIEANVKPTWIAGAPMYRWGDILAAGQGEPPARPGFSAAPTGGSIGRRKVTPR